MAFPEALYAAATMPLAQSFGGFDPQQHKFQRGDYRDAWLATLATLLDVDRHALEERDATRAARTRNLVGGIAVAVIAIVSGLGGLAWLQRGEALRQETRQLAVWAQSETRAGDATDGMLLALRSLRDADVEESQPVLTEARQALVDATLARRELLVLRGHEDKVWAAAFSPDGTRIVSGSWDGTVRVWDAASGAELLVLRGHEGHVWAAAFSMDGARIVSGARDGTVRVWDAASGAELLVLRGHGRHILATAFSEDGAHIVSGSDDLFSGGRRQRAGVGRGGRGGAAGIATSIRARPGPVRLVPRASGRIRSQRHWSQRPASKMQELRPRGEHDWRVRAAALASSVNGPFDGGTIGRGR